jgi:hypothetical protein
VNNTTTKKTYSAKDLAVYLGISLVGAYNLMESQGFPSFRIGRRILVTCVAFEKWLKEQQDKGA